jgi:hypothetical protein
MHALSDLEQALAKARAAVVEATAHAERSPALEAVEQYARATALLFGRLLAAELQSRVTAAPPSTPAAFVALIEAAAGAAWEALLRRQSASQLAPSAHPAPADHLPSGAQTGA